MDWGRSPCQNRNLKRRGRTKAGFDGWPQCEVLKLLPGLIEGGISMSAQNSKAAITARLMTILLGGTAVLAVTAAGAYAQTSGSADGVETVVVTAQHRKQNINDVPYNISAVSGDTIDENHILDTAELMRSIPGVTVVDRGDRNADIVSGIRIRGLNVDSSALGDYAVSAQATVSTYVNETPIFANFLLSPDEIDHVEVLKGPQGTLYGSNSLGGTVRYILRAPELGVFDGEVSGSLSNVATSSEVGLSGTATINIPLGDTLAWRTTITRNYYPGDTSYVNLYRLDSTGTPIAPGGIGSTAASYYDKKDADYAHQWYGRTAVLWKPTSNFDATLSFMDQNDQFGGRRTTTLGTNGLGVPYQDGQSGSMILEPATRDVYLASLEANLDLGFATLTSSTSSYDNRGSIISDNTGFYAQNGWLKDFYYNYPRPLAEAKRHYGDKGVIEELRLVSDGTHTLDYIVGAYYENQELYSAQDSFLQGFQQWWDAAYCGFFAPCEAAVLNNNDFLYRHYEHYTDAALYGDLTWHITNTFQATGGVRYFDDVDTTHVFQTTGLYASIFSESDTVGRETASKALFKGNLSWKFADDELWYATVAQGYRRGGSNGTPTIGRFAESPAWETYQPDTDIDYETGVKGVWSGITFNADIFYVDWSNPQINTATTNWGFFAVQNGKKAITEGLELQANGSLTDNLKYGVGYTYTDSHLGADLEAADGTYEINSKGAQLPGAPRHTLNGSLDYGIPLPNSANIFLHLDGYYQSSTQDTMFSKNIFLNTIVPGAYLNQPKFYDHMNGFSLWNLNATYAMDNWSVDLWVKNVLDARGVTGVYTQAYMGTSPSQNFEGNDSKALTTLPRTVGLTASLKF
jgi:iron complex outermembrane recepter protein